MAILIGLHLSCGWIVPWLGYWKPSRLVLEFLRALCLLSPGSANFPSIILWILEYLGSCRILVSTVLLVVASIPRSLGEGSFLCECF